MKVALYCRVSTTEQHPEMQLNALREYCKLRNWEIAGEFVDEGISGAKDSRPKLDEMMALVRKGKVKFVAVWRFDRFARSTMHLLKALDEFRSLGVQFVSLQEQIDTSTSMGQMVFTIFAAIGQFERDLIRERVKAGIAHAKDRGVVFGQPKVDFDENKARELTASIGLRPAAREMGLNYETLRRRLR